MLKITHFSEADLLRYVVRQMEHFFPDGLTASAQEKLRPHMDEALLRLENCIGSVRMWTPGNFDHLHSSQYTIFLYYLANTVWKSTGDRTLCNKLFGLNKTLNGIDLFYEIDMPAKFFIGHSVGIVLAKATYGEYFAIYQNSTVGKNHGDAPKLGKGVIMYPNTAIIGRCEVGSGTVISQGTSLVNLSTPGACLAFPNHSAAGVLLKPLKKNILNDIFRIS